MLASRFPPENGQQRLAPRSACGGRGPQTSKLLWSAVSKPRVPCGGGTGCVTEGIAQGGQGNGKVVAEHRHWRAIQTPCHNFNIPTTVHRWANRSPIFRGRTWPPKREGMWLLPPSAR